MAGGMKNYINREAEKISLPYHQVKLININIFQVKKYCF